ncbi:MAG: glycosyltransferase family 9 protein [Deltaproteobacteria bacterium]|nr:MAG: glycosyltransferase family 9 protein [Deltaproteobacteria bacterium]
MMQKENRIVFFHLGWLGDSVVSIPSMVALRKAFPGAHIIRLVNSRMEEFFRGCPLVDEVLPFDREAPKVREGRKLLALLREKRPTHFFNLHTPDFDRPFRHYLRDNLFAFLTGAQVRAAYSHSVDSLLLSHSVRREEFGSERMDREMLRVVERVTGPVSLTPDEISYWLTDDDRERGRRLIEEAGLSPGRYVAASPFAKRRSREWGFDRWERLLSAVKERFGLTPVVLGGRGERRRWEEAFPGGGPAVNLAGRTTLKTAAALIEMARFFVGLDSGLSHLAAVLGTPSVVLFGPGNPLLWSPMNEKGPVRIVRGEAECSPCFLDECDDMRCMTSIPEESVLEEARRVMEEA